jgi:hypothetical protein
MPARRPQINFQVDPSMKLLYEESKAAGHWVTRFCAAGLLLMVEDPAIRLQALNRLRAWEARYAEADAEQIRDFVQGAQAALRSAAPRSQPAPKARRARKKAKRTGSA